MNGKRHSLLLLVLLVLLTACSSLTRNPVPVNLMDEAVMPGMDQVRVHWDRGRIDPAQCYGRDGQFGTREVSDGTLKLRVVDLGELRVCFNWDKRGIQHPPTRHVAGRIASKNRKEFVQGRWTARLRVRNSGQPGMFPAWWLLGALNNEPPVEDAGPGCGSRSISRVRRGMVGRRPPVPA